MPPSRRQKRLGQHQAVPNDRIKGKCEVWVGNLPHYGMNTNNILLFEWWMTLVMKWYFADCLRNRFEVECIIKDEIDLDQSRNSNTYISAVLIFASEQHAKCALNLNGITFLQKKLKIGRKQPSTYVDNHQHMLIGLIRVIATNGITSFKTGKWKGLLLKIRGVRITKPLIITLH